MQVLEGTEILAGMTISSVTVVKNIEVVYASRESQPPFLMPGDYAPLWGDLDADAAIIDRLLHAIVDGTKDAFREEEGIAFSDRGLVLNVGFRDGSTWSIKKAIRCDLTPEGKMTNNAFVPDLYHWELLHPNQAAVSWLVIERALTEWFERVEEYMPTVEPFEFDESVPLGEPFSASGAGHHEGDRVELRIKFSDRSELLLGEAPLEYGAFRWDGDIPESSPSGSASVTMLVSDGTAVVWSTTKSVTVAAPTGEGAATELSDDVTWVLNSLDGHPLIEETFITLELDGDRLWGRDGCNSFASQPGDGTVVAQADGSFSTPKDILGTLRGCREPEDDLEDQADAYMSALLEAEMFRVVGNRLEIFDAKGAVRLVFVEQQPLLGYPVELVGTGWRLLPEGGRGGRSGGHPGLPQRPPGRRCDRLPRLRCDVLEIGGEPGLCLFG